MQKITPFLCFNWDAEEAARFLCFDFINAEREELTRYGELLKLQALSLRNQDIPARMMVL
jgi:predicted 3-demethylubiquinone-9 3-methyltransferase (glyoxalase superfamily)